jgi:type I restriction enzyme S subunit
MTLRVHPDEIVKRSSSPLLAKHDSWQRVRLGDVADVLNGFAFKSSQFSRDGGTPLIRIRDVGAAETQVRYTGEFDPRYLVEPGTIVVGMDGDFRAARWRGEVALLNQRVCAIRVRDAGLYDEDFLLYALPGYLDAIHSATSSTTVKHLSSETIKQIPLPIPPLAEQRRLVAAIDEQLSRLNQATLSVERAAEKLAALRRAVLDAAAADAITTWGMRPVADVCESIVNGNTPPPDRMTSGAGDIPFIKVYNLTLTGQLDFSKKPTFIDRQTHEGQLRRSRLVPGDVLINIVGPPLGKVAVVPAVYPEWNTNQAVVAFRPREGAIRSDLLALWLMSRPVLTPLVATAKATAGQFNLSISACRRLELPVPPLEKQAPLVADIQRQLSLVDSLRTATDGTLRRSAALRASILGCAFSGELVTQDPNDEPVAVLLERIANQRAAVPKRARKAQEKTPA